MLMSAHKSCKVF